jgi:MarR family transcriptional regulator, organic hydroperoxide resistance regulator
MKKTRGSDVLAALALELGRNNKFSSPGEAAVLAILRTSGLLRRSLASRFESAGLSMTQYNVLRILRGAPEGLPTLQIRRRMLEEAAGITRLVDKLAASGLIERERPGADRRQVFCRITKRGLDLLEKAEVGIGDAHAELISQLDAADATALVGLLLQAISSVRNHAESG